MGTHTRPKNYLYCFTLVYHFTVHCFMQKCIRDAAAAFKTIFMKKMCFLSDRKTATDVQMRSNL